jgi:hypothetical protein
MVGLALHATHGIRVCLQARNAQAVVATKAKALAMRLQRCFQMTLQGLLNTGPRDALCQRLGLLVNFLIHRHY